jgi:hypothetical protein
MASNEHPDMSGNPCDDPFHCYLCDETCSEEELLSSTVLGDNGPCFCSEKCAIKFDSDVEKYWPRNRERGA